MTTRAAKRKLDAADEQLRAEKKEKAKKETEANKNKRKKTKMLKTTTEKETKTSKKSKEKKETVKSTTTKRKGNVDVLDSADVVDKVDSEDDFSDCDSLYDDPNGALAEACTLGDWDEVHRAIDAGASFYNAAVEEAFVEACRSLDDRFVRFLLRRGANPNSFSHELNMSAVHAASDYGSDSVVSLLLIKGAYVEPEALVTACEQDFEDIVMTLLIEGEVRAGSLDNEAICIASEHGEETIVQLLLEHGADPSARNGQPLRIAALCKHLEVMNRLLDAGADVHSDNDAALRYVCGADLPDPSLVVERLLDAGANVHADDDAPMRGACERGGLETVRLLLEAGADVHARNGEALANACHGGFSGVVDQLLEAGADVHANEDMALILACANNDIDIVKRLLEAGATVHARNGEAFVEACRCGYLDVVELLLAAGLNVAAYGKVALTATTDEIVDGRFGGQHRYRGNAQMRESLRRSRIEVVVCLIRNGVDVADLRWSVFKLRERVRLLFAVRPSRFRTLDPKQQVEWVRYVFRPRRHLLDALFRVRARLDRPPSRALGRSKPTRKQLIANLRTAGRRFAREYWAEGLPLFFPDLDLGPVPDEFM